MTFNDFRDLYINLLIRLNTEGTQLVVRDKNIIEFINFNYTLKDSNFQYITHPKRKNIENYLKAEFDWYFNKKTNLVNDINEASSFWNKITNPDGKTVNSAYGYMLFSKENDLEISSWDWAKKQLINDNFTRQSIIHFNTPEYNYFGNRDYPCTLTGQFLYRNNVLHLIINQRSCDVIKGLTYDVPFFLKLLQNMNIETGLNADVQFHHNIGSIHVYQSDFEMMYNLINESNNFNLNKTDLL